MTKKRKKTQVRKNFEEAMRLNQEACAFLDMESLVLRVGTSEARKVLLAHLERRKKLDGRSLREEISTALMQIRNDPLRKNRCDLIDKLEKLLDAVLPV